MHRTTCDNYGGPSVDHAYLVRQLQADGTVSALTLDAATESARQISDDGAVRVPLFVIAETGESIPCTTDTQAQSGQQVLALVTAGPPVPAETE